MCYARRQRSSWARIKLSKNLYHTRLSAFIIFSSYSFLASFTLLSIYNSSWRDLVFRTSQCFVQSLLLFNFQWPFASLFPLGRDSLSIIPHSTPFVKSFFWFSSTFFLTSRLVCFASLKATRILYHFLPSLSSAFLNFFWKMYCFGKMHK